MAKEKTHLSASEINKFKELFNSHLDLVIDDIREALGLCPPRKKLYEVWDEAVEAYQGQHVGDQYGLIEAGDAMARAIRNQEEEP